MPLYIIANFKVDQHPGRCKWFAWKFDLWMAGHWNNVAERFWHKKTYGNAPWQGDSVACLWAGKSFELKKFGWNVS